MVSRRQLIGILMLIASITLFIVYTYLLFFSSIETQIMVIKYSIFTIVLLVVIGLIIVGLGLVRSPLIPPNKLNIDDCRHVDEMLPDDNTPGDIVDKETMVKASDNIS